MSDEQLTFAQPGAAEADSGQAEAGQAGRGRRFATLLRQPLLHFFVLGLAIYGGYAWMHAGETQTSDYEIRVGAGELGWLKTSFAKRWRREPTAQELDGLVKDYVRETVLYREALAMGLDRDDTIVRRRLAQKLEFLAQDLIEVSAPTQAELEAYFAEHRERYRQADQITLSHVFVDPDRRGKRTHAGAMAIRATLEERQKDEVSTEQMHELGDPFMLQRYYPERTEAELAKLFGQEFAESVAALSHGTWHGPLPSGYGLHLVYVHDTRTFAQPTLTEVRERVTTDWTAAERSALNDRYLEKLLKKYSVVVEGDRNAGLVAQRTAVR